MRAPVVHHPAYVTPLPASHRFPMPKFARLLACLRETGLLLPTQEFVPEPAPRGWLELAHDSGYVAGVLEQRLDAAAIRRLGLPLSPVLALRSRCAVAGTVLTARLALEHGIACNTAGGSHHAFAGFGSGFCVFNDVAVAARLLLAEGVIGRALVIDLDVHQGDGTAAILADDPRVFTLSVHCRANFPARKQQSDLDVALDAGVGDADYLACSTICCRRCWIGCGPTSSSTMPASIRTSTTGSAGWRSPTPGSRRGNGWCSSSAGAAGCRSPAWSAAAMPTIWMSSPAGTRCCTRRSWRCPTGSGLRPGRSCPGS